MREALNAVVASFIRTIVPAVVSFALALWAKTGIPLDPEFTPALTLLLGLVFFALYYLIIRLVETFVWPKIGWLLGLAKTPVAYTPESPANVDPITTDEITSLAAISADEARHRK